MLRLLALKKGLFLGADFPDAQDIVTTVVIAYLVEQALRMFKKSLRKFSIAGRARRLSENSMTLSGTKSPSQDVAARNAARNIWERPSLLESQKQTNSDTRTGCKKRMKQAHESHEHAPE